MEDERGAGYLTREKLIEALKDLDLELTNDQMEFIVYSVYLRSEGLEKMKYGFAIDLIDGKYVPGQLGQGLGSSGDGMPRKRPESSSPEKLKARNKEKFELI